MTPVLPQFLTRWLRWLAIALAACVALPALAQVRISQLYGGGGNSGAPYSHDFVELYNAGSAPVSLSGWTLQYTSAAGTSWGSQSLALSGSVPANGYYLVRLATNNAAVGLPLPGTPDAVGNFNMSATAGKVALVSSTTALVGTCPIPAAAVADFVGYGTNANCSEGGAVAPAPSNTTAILRAAAGCTDAGNNSTDFATGQPAPRFSGSPAGTCTGGGGGGGGGGGDAAQAATIPAIQGSAHASPMAGTRVSTSGVVTRINNNGFFMQDPAGDGNPATSDGIFVFTSTTTYPAVAVGNRVQVVGTVTEFNVGASTNTGTAARTVTELTDIGSVTLLGTGFNITPTVVSLPEAVDGDLERYEGMLITISGPLTITQNAFQGRYGQLTLAVGGRMETPTNRFRPGAQALALADENARRRILLDDGSSLQNPNPTPYFGAGGLPRAGYVTAAITGVLDYGLATSSNTGFGDYRLHPTVTPSWTPGNARSTTPPSPGGNLRVASFNVLNFFTTFTNGQTASGQVGVGCSLGNSVSASNCRGADNATEFARQRAKILEALVALNADIVGLMELQNNGNTAVQSLVDGLNAVLGAGTYASVAVPAAGTGTDAIRVGMIYKPGRVSPALAPLSDTDAVNNRPPLAQPFVAPNGERFSVVVNHLKSKGSCPAAGDADYAGNYDAGDGQSCWNQVRRLQAQRLRTFVAQVQSLAGSADVLLIGDFNAYAQEDPIFELTGSGYVDQLGRFASGIAYSYVFDGEAGRLDHAITTNTLSARVTGATHWHINADESTTLDYNLEFKAPLTTCGGLCPPDPTTVSPWRSSDHDPVSVGLSIVKTLVAASTSTSLVGTPGDDKLVSGAGRRTLTGGAGSDLFYFTASFTGGATITDFAPGVDTISLREPLQSLGVPLASPNPIASGHLRCVPSGSDAMIQIDTDAAGPLLPRAVLLIKNLGCTVLNTTNFVF